MGLSPKLLAPRRESGTLIATLDLLPPLKVTVLESSHEVHSEAGNPVKSPADLQQRGEDSEEGQLNHSGLRLDSHDLITNRKSPDSRPGL